MDGEIFCIVIDKNLYAYLAKSYVFVALMQI
jgi:hypothetical protein